MGTKTCTKCNIEKPIERFGTHRGVAHARHWCKDCDNAYQKEHKDRNPEKVRKRNREYMARVRATPEGREKLLAVQRKKWKNGGLETQRTYLANLKKTNFFRWKARKSYIWLTEEELKHIWEKQNGLCTLTGRLLDTTAELDHIIPKSRGGQDSPENAQWLCGEANQAKRNMLDSEFVALCREVVAWTDR